MFFILFLFCLSNWNIQDDFLAQYRKYRNPSHGPGPDVWDAKSDPANLAAGTGV